MLETTCETNAKRPAVTQAALYGLGTFAYYACPDVIRSRTARGVTKTLAILASSGVATYLHVRDDMAEESADIIDAEDVFATDPRTSDAPANASAADSSETGVDDPAELAPDALTMKQNIALAAIALGAVLPASIWLSVKAERAIFNRGERRRQKGKRFAHSRFAIVAGIASGVLTYVSD